MKKMKDYNNFKNNKIDEIILKKNFIAVDDNFIKHHTQYYCEQSCCDEMCEKISDGIIDSDILSFAVIVYLETISGEEFHKKWFALYDINSFVFDNTLLYDKEKPKVKRKFEKPIMVELIYKDGEFVNLKNQNIHKFKI